ncbi:hypothetical protein AAFF_G00401930, partial [Aldrovandia affinis]
MNRFPYLGQKAVLKSSEMEGSVPEVGPSRRRKKGAAEARLSGEPATKVETFNPESKSVELKRAGSPVPSCLSVKSDQSMDQPIKFRGECTADP